MIEETHTNKLFRLCQKNGPAPLSPLLRCLTLSEDGFKGAKRFALEVPDPGEVT